MDFDKIYTTYFGICGVILLDFNFFQFFFNHITTKYVLIDFQKKVFGREKEQSSTIERVNKNLCSNWINDSRLEQELNYSYSTTSGVFPTYSYY